MTDTRNPAVRTPRRPDRNALLTRVDLEAVADRFLGPPSEGRGGQLSWPCPHPEHTKRVGSAAPTLHVTGARDGIQRWQYRPCGAYGTAIDLVMLTQQRDFRETLQLLLDLAQQSPPNRRARPAGEQSHAPSRQRTDVDALLAQVDLDDLIVRLLGPGKPHGGRSRSWPCPHPQHGGQTGRTPPVTLFVGRDGRQRWHCHSCGAGGTAIDLVTVTQQRTVGEAINYLADLADCGTGPRRQPPVPGPRPPATTRPHPELLAYIKRCEDRLWSPMGMPGRNFLERRGLQEPILHANHVGYDCGPSLLPRAKGLPSGGPAIVLPVLDPDGKPLYLQARYLRPIADRRYDNPTERLVGPSPRVAFPRPGERHLEPQTALICEGMFDALTAVQAGFPAVAVLGAGYPDEEAARAILGRLPHERLMISFDDDSRGRAGGAKLAELLARQGAGHRVHTLVPGHGDLNHWLQTAGPRFATQLRELVVDVYQRRSPADPPAPSRAREQGDRGGGVKTPISPAEISAVAVPTPLRPSPGWEL